MSDSSSRKEANLGSLELRLPPLPRTLPQILRLLHEPGFVDAADMAEVAQRDPAVAARLLKQINSSYYGLRRSITSVERAIRMMGSTSAAGAAIGLSMTRMEKLLEGPAGPCFTRVVRHSEGVALLTRYLLRTLPVEDPASEGEDADGRAEKMTVSDGFTEGLLHDFGKLILIYNYPQKAVALYEDKMFEEYLADTDERVVEQLIFGYDHAEVGAYAATQMNFPSSLVKIVRYHHDAEEAPLDKDAARRFDAVRAANLASKAMEPTCSGVSLTDETIDWETCADHTIWSRWHTGSGPDGEFPKTILEGLREKKEDMILFSDFFLEGPDPWREEGLVS